MTRKVKRLIVLLKQIKIVMVEDRQEDAWFDLSLRQLRVGEVRFYRVRDFLTGEWLFKVCSDRELGKIVVKALKCPAGKPFAQLEGDTMVFQKSVIEGLIYDVASLTAVDDEGRVRREIAKSIEEVPAIIRENFEVKTYKDATGKEIPGKYLVTLCREGDEKAMIHLFLLQRAWPISPVSPEDKTKTLDLLALMRKLEKTSIEEVCQIASEEFGIRRGEIEVLLANLEKDGRVKRVGDGHVKVID